MKALTVGNGSRNRKEGIACGVLCVLYCGLDQNFWLLRRDKKNSCSGRGEEIGTLLRFLEYIILRVLFVPAFHVFIYGG